MNLKNFITTQKPSFKTNLLNHAASGIVRLSFAFEFFVKKNGRTNGEIKTCLVKDFSSFLKLENGVFAVSDMEVESILETEPLVKIGPYNNDLFAFTLSDGDHEQELRVSLVTSPSKGEDVFALITTVTDFLSKPEFYFKKESGLTIRYMNPDLEHGLNILALALNIPDCQILSRFENPKGFTGLDNWVSYSLKEQILINFLLNQSLNKVEKNEENLLKVSNEQVNSFVEDEYNSFTHVYSGIKFIDFKHVVGKNYTKDILNIFDTLNDVIGAVDKSINLYNYDVWKDSDNKENFSEFYNQYLRLNEVYCHFRQEDLQQLLEVKQVSKQSVVNATYQYYNLGRITLINGGLDNSIISKDDMMDFCLSKEEIIPKLLMLNNR